MGHPKGHGPRSVRVQVWERDQYICQFCGVQTTRPDEVDYGRHSQSTLDHLIPRCEGGANTLENLVTACWWCNHQKGSMTVRDFCQGKKGKRLLNRILTTGDREFVREKGLASCLLTGQTQAPSACSLSSVVAQTATT